MRARPRWGPSSSQAQQDRTVDLIGLRRCRQAELASNGHGRCGDRGSNHLRHNAAFSINSVSIQSTIFDIKRIFMKAARSYFRQRAKPARSLPCLLGEFRGQTYDERQIFEAKMPLKARRDIGNPPRRAPPPRTATAFESLMMALRATAFGKIARLIVLWRIGEIRLAKPLCRLFENGFVGYHFYRSKTGPINALLFSC